MKIEHKYVWVKSTPSAWSYHHDSGSWGKKASLVYAPAPGSAPAIKASGVKLKGKGEGGRTPEEERKTGSKGGRRCQ